MFANLKLRDRTLLGYAVPTGLIFVFCGLVYFTASKTIHTFNQVDSSETAILGANEMAQGLMNLDRRVRRYLLTNNSAEVDQRMASDIERVNDGAESIGAVVTDPSQESRLQEMLVLSEEIQTVTRDTMTAGRGGINPRVIQAYLDRSRELNDRFEALYEEFVETEQRILIDNIQATRSTLNLLSGSAVLTAILSLAIAIYATFLIAKFLGSRITRVVQMAERISAGDLTQSASGEAASKDEVGQLLSAFEGMTLNLNTLVRQVQQSGIQVTTSATQIAASGKELEATMTEQVASTNQVVATAKEIAATSAELLRTMDEVTAMADATTGAADNGQQGLGRMEMTMRQLAEATSSISSKLGVMSEKANNINNVVTTITKVADQTNLLSLNAAIEAEKAGEYGLGFAVVAREIRRLADQTAVATLDIEQMVKEMQSSVSTGVMEMDKFAREVDRGVEDVRTISAQLARVIEQVQALVPQFSLVNQGMDAQSQGAQQISDSMLQLSEAFQQTAISLRETNGAIEQLNDVAQNLRREISRFQVASL